MYDKFERANDDCSSVHEFSDIKDELRNYYIPSHISDKIAKAICFIYNKKKNLGEKFNNELCPYLYYWIGDKIYSNISETAKFIRIVNMIYQVLNSTNFHNICKPIKVDIDKVTFNNNKLLFDYSMNYKHIHLNTISGATRCDEDYIGFIKRYINTYNDAHENCTGTREKKYDCDYFDELFKRDEYMQLPEFYCLKYNPLTPSTEAQSAYETSQYTSPGITGSKMDPVLSVNLDPTRKYVERRSQRPHGNDSSVAYQLSDDGLIRHQEDTTEGGTSKTIAGSIVPVLGVSSFSLLLYKVTPVGGYINRLLGRNRNMYNNIEYMDAFNPYSEGMDLQDRRMNISYNRL
ncbi:hypothetical protein PVBG_05490 [Plasmodium vivax Brazil I]|uniref:VIR protein n=2 Tax=Plasmodium vivax TaxID=5855 RepID=A0A0J9STB2_PLAV1|nr:hypothetical protein PVBG_05490 [Plasmodium vivax Brazil I]